MSEYSSSPQRPQEHSRCECCAAFVFKSTDGDGALQELKRKSVVEISFPPRSLTIRNPAARQEVIGEILEISVCGCKQERAKCLGIYSWFFLNIVIPKFVINTSPF